MLSSLDSPEDSVPSIASSSAFTNGRPCSLASTLTTRCDHRHPTPCHGRTGDWKLPGLPGNGGHERMVLHHLRVPHHAGLRGAGRGRPLKAWACWAWGPALQHKSQEKWLLRRKPNCQKGVTCPCFPSPSSTTRRPPPKPPPFPCSQQLPKPEYTEKEAAQPLKCTKRAV